MAGFDQVRPGQRCLVCSVARVDAQVVPAHAGRAGGQPYRETLDSETLARERDDGALAAWRILALRWRSALVAISVEARVLTA